jgi:hypothetical protein
LRRRFPPCMFAATLALLTAVGCAARAWRHGNVLSPSSDGFVMQERFYPHTEVHVSPFTRFQCGRHALRFSDLQPNETVTVEGSYRHDGSIEATKVAILRKRSECGIGAGLVKIEGRRRQVPQPNWDLRYRSGSFSLKRDQWLKGAFQADSPAETATSPTMTIARDQVRAIYFDSKALRNSDVAQRMPRSRCYPASSLMPKEESAPGSEVFVTWVASRGPIMPSAERPNPRYPVRFVWNDDGTEKELVVTVNYCEYASFVANLRRFAEQSRREVVREFPR